ncbi:MAG: winged helix-turn-helix transcriptional regulator [Acetobacteraceae bacterium]
MRLKKITIPRNAAARRRYDDACAAAHALDLVGDRWALLVMRELMMGPKRFSDLREGLPGISANVLTQRLEELEVVGVLTRHRLPPPTSAQVYELTAWGYEAEPVLQALGRWAARSPAHDPTLPLSTTSFLLSLRTMIDPARAAGIDALVGLRLDGETFLARLRQGAIAITRDAPAGADVVFTASAAVLARAIYGGAPLQGLEASGELRVEGDHALAERFITLFPLPPKADQPKA